MERLFYKQLEEAYNTLILNKKEYVKSIHIPTKLGDLIRDTLITKYSYTYSYTYYNETFVLDGISITIDSILDNNLIMFIYNTGKIRIEHIIYN